MPTAQISHVYNDQYSHLCEWLDEDAAVGYWGILSVNHVSLQSEALSRLLEKKKL